MSPKTASKYIKSGELPSAQVKDRDWRTREQKRGQKKGCVKLCRKKVPQLYMPFTTYHSFQLHFEFVESFIVGLMERIGVAILWISNIGFYGRKSGH